MENLKKQATELKKCIAENGTLKKKLCYYKAKTRNLEADKAKKKKKNESDPSFLLKLDLKEQVKFLENEKLLLKEQLDNFQNNKVQLFKKGQYSNSARAAYQDLISFAGVSANKVDKVVDIVLTQSSQGVVTI